MGTMPLTPAGDGPLVVLDWSDRHGTEPGLNALEGVLLLAQATQPSA